MKRPSSKQPKERKPLTGSLPAGGGGTMIAHDLNGVWHNGIAGTEDNFMALDATGLPKDSGKKASDFQTALGTDTNAALAGTDGIPSSTNKFVTNSDPRLSGGLPTYSDAADIIAAFAAGEEFNIAAGTYDCNTTDCIAYDNARYHCIGDVTLQFADGYGFKSWTAANSGRYYLKEGHAAYWNSTKFTKTAPTGAGTDYPALDGTWRFLFRGRAFTCTNASDATNVYVTFNPVANASYDTSAEARYPSLIQPTYNVHGTGKLTIEGKTGHTGELAMIYGLFNSSIDYIRVKPPTTLTSSKNQGLVWGCYNSQITCDIQDQVNSGTPTANIYWWTIFQNHMCYIVEGWQNISFVNAISTNYEHVVYHNGYNAGGIIRLKGSGAYVSISGGSMINRGADGIYNHYVIFKGTAIDAQKTSGTGDSLAWAYRDNVPSTPMTLISTIN
jgi:hypothetical protein